MPKKSIQKNKIKKSEKSDNMNVLKLMYVDYKKIQEPLKLQEFIRWISIPKGYREPKTYKEFAIRIGVSQDTLTDWKHLLGFWKEVQKEQQGFFREETTEVLAGLLERAKTGRAQEVKLYLQYFEGFSDGNAFIDDSIRELTEEEVEDIERKLKIWGVVNPAKNV